MKVSHAIANFFNYQKMNSKKNTVKNYRLFLNKFEDQFRSREIETITSDEIMNFLTGRGEGQKQSTKHFKYTLIQTFFNFIQNTVNSDIQNPCNSPILKKIFRAAKWHQWKIVEKDIIDALIFKTDNPRDRLMLELMGRGGMRIGEVLKLRAKDVDDRKLFLKNPKSGRQSEVVFIPKKVADRLREYIRSNGFEGDQRIFPMGYTGARGIVKRAGRRVDIDLKPHDLRRHAATYASRSGAPLEIVSKVILRHANLSTTQRYLGKISDVEAIRWVENIYE